MPGDESAQDMLNKSERDGVEQKCFGKQLMGQHQAAKLMPQRDLQSKEGERERENSVEKGEME